MTHRNLADSVSFAIAATGIPFAADALQSRLGAMGTPDSDNQPYQGGTDAASSADPTGTSRAAARLLDARSPNPGDPNKRGSQQAPQREGSANLDIPMPVQQGVYLAFIYGIPVLVLYGIYSLLRPKKKNPRRRRSGGVPMMTEAQSRERVRELRAAGYVVNRVRMPDGSTVVVRRRP